MRQQPDGRDRDAVAADARAAGVAQDLGGADHVVVVLERLALALEHDAGHGPLRATRAGRVSTCSTISQASRLRVEAEPAGLAERAGQRAADLRRDAHAAARPLERDAHGLEDAAVVRAEEVLHEGIDVAPAPVDDLQPLAAPALAQLARERLRQARHAVEVVPVLARSGDARRAAPRAARGPATRAASVSGVWPRRCETASLEAQEPRRGP